MIDIDNINTSQDMATPTGGPTNNTNNPTMNSTSSQQQLSENCLLVDISDALSEKDKVKFTVHTRTTLKEFQKSEFFVVRQHEEFVWLHDRFEENPAYAGYIIPPAPPRPDFDASREKLQRLGEGEGTMTKEEFTKMKQELEAEYLATFKKTVAMHEVFLTRLANHTVFRLDQHLHVFLEFDQDLCARPKNKLQLLGGLVKSLGSTTDQYYLGATVHDVDDFFEHELNSLNEYYNCLKEGVIRADRMTHKHKDVADTYILISSGLVHLATLDQNLDKFLTKCADVYEKIRKVEGRVASDEDLKLADILRYYQRDSNAARSLLIRRLKCLAQYEAANRNLERVRAKNKDANGAEKAQSLACEQFEQISSQAKEELQDFRVRRVNTFKKSLIELAELEIKHARTQHELLRKSVASLKELL